MRLLLLGFLATAVLPAAAQVMPTPIGTIQGTGSTALAGAATIEGIVTAVYPAWGPAGFFVQNDAATADADPLTSDAIYVVQTAPTVLPGTRVRVTGTVAERATAPSNGLAIITAPTIAVLASGQPLPPFVVLDNATFSPLLHAEAVEGMRVRFTGPLTVIDPGAIRTRGELLLSVRGLAYQPTQVVDPNDANPSGTTSMGNTNLAAVQAFGAENAAKRLFLDDGRTNVPPVVPYLDPLTGAVRVGSTVADARGIMGFGSGQWRLQPLPAPDVPVVVTTRPAPPTFAATPDLRLASFNVLNYFNGNGTGGGFPTARGARTLPDFQRQRAKIVRALAALDADVVGLMEIENDGTGPTSAIQDLLHHLNRLLGAPVYTFVNDGTTTQTNSSDVIRCAIIYKPARVTPLGAPILSADQVFDRPPLAQVFVTPAADTVALVVNHFKSKASGSGVDADQGDGQGRSNNRRRLQAAALVPFLSGPVAAAGGRRAISVGDYNANFEEDPLDVLRAAGLVIPSTSASISYVFNDQVGALDHAVITPNLVGRVAVRKWNINAVEPEFLQYDVAKAATDTLSPFRSSDHDPVLIGVRFAGFPVGTAGAGAPATGLRVFPNPTAAGFRIELPAGEPTRLATVEVLTATGQLSAAITAPAARLADEVARQTQPLAPGVYWLRLRGAGSAGVQRVVKE